MGWSAEDMPTPQGPVYTMFRKDGKDVAAMSQMPPDMKGHPSAWNCYVTVKSVDQTVKKAQELGGKEAMPAMEVMDAGRMAGIMDATGAALMVWEPNKHIGAQLVNTVGAMGWNELYTRDVEAAKKFYGGLFGWTFETDVDGYTVIKNKGRMNGGMMEIKPEWEKMPQHWAVYFTVENLEETLKTVEELGGKVYGDIIDAKGIGRLTRVAEPTGAVFFVIELENKADEWVE